jgi:hypothetical protein
MALTKVPFKKGGLGGRFFLKILSIPKGMNNELD